MKTREKRLIEKKRRKKERKRNGERDLKRKKI